MKILYIGNCQSKPLNTISKMLCEKKGARFFSINHKLLLVNPSKAEEIINNCDLIISQPLSDRFDHYSTKSMKERFGERFIVIPNLFFQGYFPDLTYSGNEGQRNLSPIGDYHSALAIASFKLGVTSDRAVRVYNNQDFWSDPITSNIPNESLKELKVREVECDIKVSDFVEEYYRSRPLFFTVNHPTSILFKCMVERIFDFLGVRYASVDDFFIRNNLIDGPIFAMPEAYKNAVDIEFSQPNYFSPLAKGGKLHNLNDFFKASHNLYETIPVDDLKYNQSSARVLEKRLIDFLGVYK
jgi:hypothetical protein